MMRRASIGVAKNVNELLTVRCTPIQSQLSTLPSGKKGDKGYVEQVVDKTKEVAQNIKETVKEKAHDAKETVKDAYNTLKENPNDPKTSQKLEHTDGSWHETADGTRKMMSKRMEEEGQNKTQ